LTHFDTLLEQLLAIVTH